MYTHKETYFKELAHTVVGADKSKICRAGQQARNAGRISMLILRQINSFFSGKSHFLLLRHSSDF